MTTKRADSGPRLVILDCDGVLFDSLRSNIAYYNAVLDRMGEPPMDEEAVRLCHVYSTPQLFTHLYAHDPEKAQEAVRVAYEIDYKPFLEYMDPEPGLHGVLAELKRSYMLALATNRGTSVPPLLERFGLQGVFDVVSTILEVPRPKPAPDLLLYCLDKTGIPPGRAVYVGDMDNDRVAAKAAGVGFVLKGNNIRHPVRIQRLKELPRVLTGPSAWTQVE